MAAANDIVADWPEESKEAAQLVMQAHGQPDEACASLLIWHERGPWRRIMAYREYDRHEFPAPHIDSVESFIPYNVPTEKVSELAAFDGSVVVNRTRGELSARCHDEQANFLALNLAHDIVTGQKTVQEARDYYAYEFLAYRRGDPTPYMDGLHFIPQGAGDPDERTISNDQLAAAREAAKAKH
jgi:hypothetical protein